MNKTAYLFTRLAIGVSMFGHGLVRLPKLPLFSNWMVTQFEKSILPRAIVAPFSYILPFAEFLIGLFLIIGLFTKQAATTGVVAMLLLIFGSTTIENWDIIPSQLIHIAFFVFVIQFVQSNSYAMDKLRKH
ncbi:MAG TPA: DoxX family membrane protein [Arachidicoccus sp.]